MNRTLPVRVLHPAFDDFAPPTLVDEEARTPLPPRADAREHSMLAKLGAYVLAGALTAIVVEIIVHVLLGR
jgi:hypothetical protein